MRSTAKERRRVIRGLKEKHLGGVHLDLIGPRELVHDEKAEDAAIDFLRSEILATRDSLKDCGKINPALKRFRFKAIRTCVIRRCPTCARHRRTHSAARENRS